MHVWVPTTTGQLMQRTGTPWITVGLPSWMDCTCPSLLNKPPVSNKSRGLVELGDWHPFQLTRTRRELGRMSTRVW